jgi:hypothetical protein
MPKRLTRGALHATEKGLGLNFRSALSLSDSLVQNNIHFTWQCPGTSIPFYIYPQLLMPQLSLTPM